MHAESDSWSQNQIPKRPTNRDFFPSNVFYLCVLFKKWMPNNFSVEGEAVLVKVRNVWICINRGYYNIILKNSGYNNNDSIWG